MLCCSCNGVLFLVMVGCVLLCCSGPCYVVLLLMVLSLFGVDIRPILAGAGVVGLAIGFGAQSLVKDFVSGLFILVEDQYGIGDKVLTNSEKILTSSYRGIYKILAFVKKNNIKSKKLFIRNKFYYDNKKNIYTKNLNEKN